MARSGRSVHGDIKRKIREVQSEFEGLSTRYDETERTMSQMIDERESHYMTIASHCLPELERDAVNNTIRGMKTKIRDIFDEKQERREQLQQLMLKNRESNTEVEGEIDTLTQKIEHLAEQRDETMSVILYDLKKHDLYTGLKEDAGEAQTKLTSFEERVQDVTERIQEYLPSFEEHFVFNYLHSRGFGTNEYTKSGLIKKFDTFAARATHFLENKKRYDFLMSVPELMNHEVIRRQETLDDIAKQMGVIEREIEEKHGLPHLSLIHI